MAQPPNIIILILDTLRAGNVSSYGYAEQTSPQLDAFAGEGVLFRRAISPATWTIPSHASMLSGLYISQHRIESIKGDRRFNEAIVPLPAALRSQGYRTAGFSQNMLFSPSNQLDGGFDEFYDVEKLFGARSLTRLIQRLSDDADGRLCKIARYLRKMMMPRLVLDKMHDWIAAGSERSPFFLFANVLSPHFPWAVPLNMLPREGFRMRYLLKSDFLALKKQWEFNSDKQHFTDEHRRVWRLLYDAAIRHVDDEVGRFLGRVRRLKGWENTIVVVTADHGELLGDYRDIVGHMLSLHDNLIHVPLIVRHPEYPRGLTVERVVQTMDLYPSVLEWAGCRTEHIPAAQLQRPALSQAVSAPGDTGGLAFAEEDYTDSYNVIEKLLDVNPAMDPRKYPRQQLAVRSATHKYVWYDDRPADFYDLTADPGEQHSLIDTDSSAERQVLTTLEQALATWRSGLKVFPPRFVDDVAEVDATTMDRLRGLGYVA